MTIPDDPRNGITVPAGESMEGAAALVSSWLMENTHGVKDRIEFVRLLDDYLSDFDFTLGCVKVLAPGLPECGP